MWVGVGQKTELESLLLCQCTRNGDSCGIISERAQSEISDTYVYICVCGRTSSYMRMLGGT